MASVAYKVAQVVLRLVLHHRVEHYAEFVSAQLRDELLACASHCAAVHPQVLHQRAVLFILSGEEGSNLILCSSPKI
jgi:hypothetical protein